MAHSDQGKVEKDRRFYRDFVVLTFSLVVLLSVFSGCSSNVRVTDPARTATEQFLLSTASTRAIDQLTVDALRGRTVYVDTQYFGAPDKEFVTGKLRARLLMDGVQLVPDREMAQVVMEVRSGGVGIDRSDFLLGIPSVVLRAGQNEDGETTIPLATPELALFKNVKQRGIASVAFVAYWKDSGEIVASSGPFIGWTRREDWWIFGFGPKTVGDIAPTEEPLAE